MNEKPFRLDMGFTEAITRLSRAPKKKALPQSVDYAKEDVQSKSGAAFWPRRSAGKSDPAG